MRNDFRCSVRSRSFLPASLAALLAITAIAGAAVVGACNPGVFDELRDAAGVVVAEAPDGYARAGYGTVLASFSGPLAAVRVSRLVASADGDSQVRVYSAWTGTRLQMDPAAYDVCKDAGDCETGAGAALAGIGNWRGEGLCVAIGAPNSDLALVRCEDSPTMAVERVQPAGVSGSRFGAALAGLPSGELLVGAPLGGTGGVGTVYLANALSGTTEIAALGPARSSGVTKVGARIAAGATAGGGAIAAITASGSTQRRVIVIELDAGGAATLLACLDADVPNAAFGSVVAVGNLIGDDTPDVVVGDDPSLPARRAEVRIYDGAMLRTGGACVGPAPAPTVITCANTRGVACTDSGFGTSLAIGDVNGDGRGDLAIGAPLATFQGVANSGAVWLIPGTGTALAASLDTASADVLTDSEPTDSARLGTSVAMLESRDGRFEVAAGAPGSAEVFVFACSGLMGDGVTAGPLCIPAAP